MAEKEAAVLAGRRVALFPLPFQGHLSPMLQLAALLRARGLAVAVLHTDFNAPDPARHHRDLAFIPIRETLPEEATSPDADIVAQLLALNAACEAPFRDALASLLPDVACAPCFADQTVNARYVTHQWGVGLELGEVFARSRAAEASMTARYLQEIWWIGFLVDRKVERWKLQEAIRWLIEGEEELFLDKSIKVFGFLFK
uniref:Uncharacterized protein n=1 Tax=Oryza brachyantha TaxID=4533 RepID=J3MJP1_ORYBR